VKENGLETEVDPSRGLPWPKIIVFAVVATLIVLGYAKFGETLSPVALAERESELRQFQADHPVLVYGVAFLIYVVVTGLSLPVATGLTLIFSWYFGFARALVLISFASTAGATVAFLLSRYLIRDSVQRRFGARLTTFNEALEREGALYLFTLRLIPAVPFLLINLLMGLTPMKTRTYWWVSQLGMFPGTCVYVYAGSSIPNLQTLAKEGIGAVLSPWQLFQILTAIALLGVFPLAVKTIMRRFRPSSTTEEEASGR
jgi:uncharacterized membrane protein YdjX (TVP38/TMEM64 family)